MSVFSRVPAGHPKRHYFNLTSNKKFDCHIGELIPFDYIECIPGDKVKLRQQSVVRFTPLVAPIMHEIYLYTWYFFVPTRILFRDSDNELYDKDKLLELFFGGGKNGDIEINLPKYTDTSFSLYSVPDYLGYPLSLPSVQSGDEPEPYKTSLYKGVLPFPVRAYNVCYNEFFRDENLIDEIDIDQKTIQRVAWKKDYFTSALPFQQRGASPLISFPLVNSPVLVAPGQVSVDDSDVNPRWLQSWVGATSNTYQYIRNGSTMTSSSTGYSYSNLGRNVLSTGQPLAIDKDGKNILYADNSVNNPTLNINDIRLSFQVQRFLERNALGGSCRYTELLRSHFGIAPNDDVLQRPQYIGGSKSPIMVSEVSQTSESGTTPQGNLAGKGLNADINSISTYTAKEFGYIVCLCAIRPELGYCSQGIKRDLLRYTKYDFPFPAFMMLSERQVYNCEIYADTNDPMGVFGYQGMFNELRTKQNEVAGGFRNLSGYKQWHLNRSFASLPNLGKDFIECQVPKDSFANTSDDVRECLCTIQTDCDCYRPIPLDPQPGLVDHIYGG